MNQLMNVARRAIGGLSALRDLPPLLFRLILAYGFWMPALTKWRNIDSTAKWFASMGYPFPELNVYLSATTELTGAILLTLGLATRLISVPLSVVMIVAITTVHWKHGFAAGHNGFEIPLYYLVMLFSLIVGGAGRVSLDHQIARFFRARGEAVASSDGVGSRAAAPTDI
ncbi:MAG: DoxX family protein [Myxococcales bacterium]|nr:DoxX family protein [Myxococcales bacterium]